MATGRGRRRDWRRSRRTATRPWCRRRNSRAAVISVRTPSLCRTKPPLTGPAGRLVCGYASCVSRLYEGRADRRRRAPRCRRHREPRAAASLALLAFGELPPHAASVLIYGVGLLAVFGCSAAYH